VGIPAEELIRLPLLKLVPALSPAFAEPIHLADWAGLIERAATEPVRGLCSIPIRHFKTETTIHGIMWLLLRDPTLRIMFMTHSFEAAAKWGKRIRQLAEALDELAGKEKGWRGPTRGWNTISEWRNESGGGVVVMSADQSKIGYDCHVLIVDDSIDEHGAQDPKTRETVDDNITHYTARCTRNGKRGPVLIVASRFHPDDPIGRRIMRSAVQWEYIHHAAITRRCDRCESVCGEKDTECACGGTPVDTAFAPNVWGLDELRQVRAELAEKDPTERLWFAQFQNDPRPMGSDLFGTPHRYHLLPPWSGFRIGYGADFSYSQGEKSDWFVLIAGRVYGKKLYILDRQRYKIDPIQIESTCKAFLTKYGHAPIFSYQSGPEIGLSRVLRERGVPIVPLRARYNKLVRAQRTIKRWNDGDILLPEDVTQAHWIPNFVHMVTQFRGNDHDDGDDDADALVSLADSYLGGAQAAAPMTLGTPGYS
jgi:predicted phage terminase large subunit-like protein